MAAESFGGPYCFPYPPYDIQTTLMSNIYDVFTHKKVGIFESPTGTGKTLCIISAALRWLRDSYARDEAGDVSEDESGEQDGMVVAASASKPALPSWILSASDRMKQARAQERKVKAEERCKRRAKVSDRISQVVAATAAHGAAAVKRAHTSKAAFHSVSTSGDGVASGAVPATVESVKSGFGAADPPPPATKILFCSRTHSQLAQFVSELRKSPLSRGIRVATLGSRSMLCINPEVKALGSDTAMNERCLELQDKSAKSSSSTAAARLESGFDDIDDEHVSVEDDAAAATSTPSAKRKRECIKGCEFYSADKHAILADLSQAEPLDIEELAELGKDHRTCPYYGVKAAIPDAEVVVMPYTTLLHEATRNSYGLTPDALARCVIVFDEAHNVIDAINAMYSCTLSSAHLAAVDATVAAYFDKYRSRLGSQSVLWISSLMSVVKLLRSFLSRCGDEVATAATTIPSPSATEPQQVFTIAEFITAAGLSTADFSGILRYIEGSGIARKLRGFTHVSAVAGADSKADVTVESAYASPVAGFQAMQSLFSALLTTFEDGRVLFKPAVTDGDTVKPCAFKFSLLNPGSRFAPLLEHARSIVLIGGTLQPIHNLTAQLLQSCDTRRIQTLSVGHVVPSDHVGAVCLSKSPSGGAFNFAFGSRDSATQLLELGQAIVNITSLVPQGSSCVCFFPSYDFEQKVWLQWAESGVRDRLAAKSKLYREPKSSADMPAVLDAYATDVSKGIKCLLSCVVGGKMSEGINFSDNLARAVIVVGMPFANIKDSELQARMQYLDRRASSSGGGGITGREYYTDLCMKAVNQSIGRSIRHARDYACIVLIDERYDSSDIQARLPKWMMRGGPISHSTFGSAYHAIAAFFKRHAAKGTAGMASGTASK